MKARQQRALARDREASRRAQAVRSRETQLKADKYLIEDDAERGRIRQANIAGLRAQGRQKDAAEYAEASRVGAGSEQGSSA